MLSWAHVATHVVMDQRRPHRCSLKAYANMPATRTYRIASNQHYERGQRRSGKPRGMAGEVGPVALAESQDDIAIQTSLANGVLTCLVT